MYPAYSFSRPPVEIRKAATAQSGNLGQLSRRQSCRSFLCSRLGKEGWLRMFKLRKTAIVRRYLVATVGIIAVNLSKGKRECQSDEIARVGKFPNSTLKRWAHGGGQEWPENSIHARNNANSISKWQVNRIRESCSLVSLSSSSFTSAAETTSNR